MSIVTIREYIQVLDDGSFAEVHKDKDGAYHIEINDDDKVTYVSSDDEEDAPSLERKARSLGQLPTFEAVFLSPRHVLVREIEVKLADPTAIMIDEASVKIAPVEVVNNKVPEDGQSLDGQEVQKEGPRTRGQKRQHAQEERTKTRSQNKRRAAADSIPPAERRSSRLRRKIR